MDPILDTKASKEEPGAAYYPEAKPAAAAAAAASYPQPEAAAYPDTETDSYEDVEAVDIDEDEFLRDVRHLQRKTKCSNKTCLEFINLFSKHVDSYKCNKTFAACDKELKAAAGVEFMQLDGCVGCNRFVFSPKDQRTECPCCGHARHRSDGKALEASKTVTIVRTTIVRTTIVRTIVVYGRVYACTLIRPTLRVRTRVCGVVFLYMHMHSLLTSVYASIYPPFPLPFSLPVCVARVNFLISSPSPLPPPPSVYVP